eukprot:3384073-Rhodomonas_salina.1
MPLPREFNRVPRVPGYPGTRAINTPGARAVANGPCRPVMVQSSASQLCGRVVRPKDQALKLLRLVKLEPGAE